MYYAIVCTVCTASSDVLYLTCADVCWFPLLTDLVKLFNVWYVLFLCIQMKEIIVKKRNGIYETDLTFHMSLTYVVHIKQCIDFYVTTKHISPHKKGSNLTSILKSVSGKPSRLPTWHDCLQCQRKAFNLTCYLSLPASSAASLHCLDLQFAWKRK